MLDADVTENFFYRPTTRATNQVYEQLLVLLQQQLGDQPDEVLRGAADEVLQVLKEDGLKEGERKRGIEAVLGPLTQERFTKLFQLSKNITDFMGADQEGDEAGARPRSFCLVFFLHAATPRSFAMERPFAAACMHALCRFAPHSTSLKPFAFLFTCI